MPFELEDASVLDLSHMLPGPYCHLILADEAAEVAGSFIRSDLKLYLAASNLFIQSFEVLS